MPVTRRTAFAVLALGLSGCAASPVVSGAPAVAPTSPPPTQSPVASGAQSAVAELEGLLRAISGVSGWEFGDWTKAALAQCAAQLDRLSLPDPFGSDEQERFTATAQVTATPASPEAAAEALTAQLTAAVEALETAATAAATGGERLLYASAATATSALSNRNLAPVAGGAVPVRLQATTLEASLPIALGHAWALIHGFGVGLGRLSSKDPLHDLGTARLAIAKGLRNDLRAAFEDEAPEQPAAFELPGAMSTPDEIRAGWAVLETNLLDGYARLVAASDDPGWRLAMRAQVAPVQAVGGTLGYWPGWYG